METQALSKTSKDTPLFDDFFKPWNEWLGNNGLWGRVTNVPGVNIVENKDAFEVALAAPGLKKDDFRIDVEGNMLTISSEKEENKEERKKKFTRMEYSYASFSRSFTLPEEINREKIEARYEEGVLKITLPRHLEVKKNEARKIMVK